MASFLGFSWTSLFLLVSAYGLVRYFTKPKNDKRGQINWTPTETVAVTLLIYFAAQLAAALMLYVVPFFNGWSLQKASDWLDTNAYGQFLLVLLMEAVTAYLLYKFIKRRGANFQTLGLKKPRWADLAYVLVGWVAYFGGFLIVLNVVKQLVPGLDTNQQQQLGFNHAGGLQLPFVFVALVVLPPLVEELLVRGFLYSGLKKGLPLIWAALVTSLLFASAHLQPGSGEPLLWSAAIDTFVLSMVLIYIKEKTGSLAACIGLHMLKNFIAFLGLFVFHLV